ncbi:MAG TPA: peptidoglycan-associated lipoprotein Pal [Burkholderiaceae bacterium]
MNKPQILLTLIAAAALAGCSTVGLDDAPAKIETRTPQPTPPMQPSAAQPKPTATSTVTQVDIDAAQTAAVSNLRVVYFDYDSYAVKDEYRAVVEAHAKRLGLSPSVRLRLEGNTDERGGSEYNLALGQKRAEAVGKSLALLGVAANRYEAVSYGKEQPADAGHNEAAWAKNRRVELKDM